MGKSHLELKDQLELLVSIGMTVSDETACLKALGSIGYYRLSADIAAVPKRVRHKR